MEEILTDYVVIGSGAFFGGLVLLALAFGGILLGYLSEMEKAGKRFFWTESSPPGAELRDFLPREVTGIHRAA